MRYILTGFLAIALVLFAFSPKQELIIRGIVKDQSGTPIEGASVTEKQNNSGVHKSTMTAADGSFSLSVSGKNVVLLFQMIGYETQELKLVVGDIPMQVMLLSSVLKLQEVVVTGYGTTEKKDPSDSRTIIDDKSFYAASPRAQTSVMLSGKAAGLTATTRGKHGKHAGAKDKFTRREEEPENFNTEAYDAIVENRFLAATENPLSTFSIDVDGSSYSNVRRYLLQGEKPPEGAVRIEELINYFHYDYPQPSGNDPFSINTEIGECAWNTSHKLVMIGLQGKKIPMDKLPASNLVFLIDVSGSMQSPEKLPLVQQSLKLLVDQLRPQDRVSLVVYAGNAGLVMPSTSGAEKIKIKDAIDRLEAGGSTAGGAGIQLAYEVAEQNFVKEGNNRVILCTDGDFNVGPSSDAFLEKLIEKERKTGVFLTVLGYGMGNYKDSKMEKLADKGNGNHAYIDNESEAKKVLVNEFGGTLFTIAKDVKLQIEFNPAKVQSYRLIGYENRLLNKEDFNNDRKDAGELGSGHTVTALYEIIPVGVKNDFSESVDPLKYKKAYKIAQATGGNEMLTIKFRYKNPDSEVSRLIVHPVPEHELALSQSSVNFRFVSSVAAFGMLLRNSDFKQNASYNKAYALAKNALGTDSEGYRREFLQLLLKTEKIAKTEKMVGEEISANR